MIIQLGSFVDICQRVSLSLCPLIGPTIHGIEPTCYARNISFGSWIIFQPATIAVHFIGLVMACIMIYHIKTKYTAVGRKEMVIFFYLYLVTLVVDSVVSSGLVPSNTTAYLHLTSCHFALISAGIWCLLGNGFVGFQFAEDGTPMSIWTLRLSSLVVFASTYFLCYGTFTNLVSFLDPVKPTLLWVGFFGFNAGALIIYLILQVILITNTLSDLWPLGDIIIGSLFFIAGQLGMLFSSSICTMMNHYLDGQFVASVFTLLTVMMIYKYWDSITKEDLEFHVGGKIHPWERLSKSSTAPSHRMSTRGAIL